MENNVPFTDRNHGWSAEALALAAQAKVLSGNKLEQLVVRLQRNSGRSRQACWRFVIQYGLKGRLDYRRWTSEEIDLVREELVKHSVAEVAKRLNRTARSIRSMLHRNSLGVKEIRCDLFSLGSLAAALNLRKSEILFWIKRGWLEAQISRRGKLHTYTITPEALAHTYKHHLSDLLKRGVPNQSLFEAYVQYVHSPKHTVGEHLLEVRRDKRERTAFLASKAQEIDSNPGQESGQALRPQERCSTGDNLGREFPLGQSTKSDISPLS
jgi:hypothetical protein